MALGIFLLDTQASGPPALCNQKLLNEFRGLYIELQRSLNYEKQDAEIINGKVQLKPHPKKQKYHLLEDILMEMVVPVLPLDFFQQTESD